jgi:cell division protein FtsA
LNDSIVCLDIGTSVVRAVIGDFNENNVLQITGTGQCATSGLRNGLIVNIEETTRAIRTAIEAVEMVSGYEVSECVASIGGAHIAGLNSKGFLTLPSLGGGDKRMREVTQHDVERVIQSANWMQPPPDRQILHVIPQSYIVDGQGGIKNPVNMIGTHLEAAVHIITAAITPLQNIQRCISRAGYTLAANGVMLKTLAATQAVMTDEELELGSILIDLGGGTTDVLVLYDGAPICTASLPYGGIGVTNDIAVVKGISFDTAERIKLSSGSCWGEFLDEEADVIIPGVGGGRPPESVSRLELCGIIRPQVENILEMVRREVYRLSSVDSLSGNIVLVGGGALMQGVVELTQEVFNTSSVRVGYPRNFGGVVEEYRSPVFAAAAGLFYDAMDKRKNQETAVSGKRPVWTIGEKISKVFREFF